MNWYLQSSENSDVAKSTRIRLARNLHDFKFNLEQKKDIEALENKVKQDNMVAQYQEMVTSMETQVNEIKYQE